MVRALLALSKASIILILDQVLLAISAAARGQAGAFWQVLRGQSCQETPVG